MQFDNLKCKIETRTRKSKWAGLVALALAFTVAGAVAMAQPQKIYKIGRLSAGAPTDPLSTATY